MTKSEFVDEVSASLERNGVQLTKKDAAGAVDAVIETIQASLTKGEEVTFAGFGKFHVAHRSARQGVHPRTGQPIQIAASKVPRFTAGSGLKKAVKESGGAPVAAAPAF